MPNPTDYIANQTAGIDLLFGTTLTGSAALVDTGTLATGYRDLMIFVTGRTNRAITNGELLVQFNGDSTATNYEGRYKHTGDSHTDAVASEGFMGYVPGTSADASRVTSNEIHVLNHENTTFYKAYHGKTGAISTTGFRLQTEISMLWLDTSAITSIQFKVFGGDDFLADSTFSVYGVR